MQKEMTLSEGLHVLADVADALAPLQATDRISFFVSYPGLYVTANGADPDEKKANAAAAARVVRDITGSEIKKRYSHGDVELRIAIVPHELVVKIVAGGVCTRKVVGTETVEVEKVVSKTTETVTEEREIVEWDCGGGLNLNGADNAEA